MLSKMNQTLYRLGFYSVGCAVSPHHIPFILPPPPPPQALHDSDSFYSLISASWRPPGMARQARCPGTEPAGHSPASLMRAPRGTGRSLSWRTGSVRLFRALGGCGGHGHIAKHQRNGLPSASSKVAFCCLKHLPPSPVLPHSFPSTSPLESCHAGWGR